MLILSGFRHTALRELIFHFEASVRSHYIDSTHLNKTYDEKVRLLEKVRFRKFKGLLHGLTSEKQEELFDFYHKLCDYVHLSETSHTDALKDFSLNLAIGNPNYEQDNQILEKTFDYSIYLLKDS